MRVLQTASCVGPYPRPLSFRSEARILSRGIQACTIPYRIVEKKKLRKLTADRPVGPGAFIDPNLRLVLGRGPYAHLNLEEVQDAILQIEGLDLASIDDTHHQNQSNADQSLTLATGHHGLSPSDLNAIRAVVADASGTLGPKAVHAMMDTILQARLRVTNRILKDELTKNGRQVLQAAMQAAGPPAMIGGLDDHLRNLPMRPTRMNIELVRLHLQLLSRFKASLDGRPDPGSRFMKHWVPLSIKDPLLLHIVLYTAACFLNETGHVPKALVWVYKGAAHKMLNDHLRCTGKQINDSAIMGTAQMTMDSWYWGTTEELRAHMAGLKAMVKLRGGPQLLGMQGLLAKTVLTHDIVIALAHDVEPTMYGLPGFEFHDHFMVPYQVSFNSPILMNWPPFLNPATISRIHPLSEAILDDMRSVLTLVLSLPSSPTADDLQKIHDVAAWCSERLDQMPEDVTVRNEDSRGPFPVFTNSDEHHDGEVSSPGQASEISGSSPRSIGPPSDVMYRCIRFTASTYLRAISSRVPMSQVVSIPEVLHVWEMVWEVTVSTWKTAVGIFLWILIAVVPSCHHTPVARFIKTFMVTGFMTMSLENWHVGVDMAEAALRLQRWLRCESDGDDEDRRERDDNSNGEGNGIAEGGGVIGGEEMIEKHGYLFRDEVPEFATHQFEGEEFIN